MKLVGVALDVDGGPPSEAEFAALREHFKDREIAALTFVVCAIRAFNMLNVSFHVPVPDRPYVSKA